VLYSRSLFPCTCGQVSSIIVIKSDKSLYSKHFKLGSRTPRRLYSQARPPPTSVRQQSIFSMCPHRPRGAAINPLLMADPPLFKQVIAGTAAGAVLRVGGQAATPSSEPCSALRSLGSRTCGFISVLYPWRRQQPVKHEEEIRSILESQGM